MITIVLAKPLGGKREHTFEDGKKLSDWVWKNAIHIFTSIPKNEQRD